MTSEEDKQAYVQQIIYANKIMARIVDSITAQSNNNAIIIIQGDHGYRFFDPGKKQLEFPNFNAILLPGNDYRLFSDTMTSVNTFRTVFNTIFNSNYPILPAETYFLKYK
jgi:membrane-anchored protein YejM (alkaline phosphatase superfamily)